MISRLTRFLSGSVAATILGLALLVTVALHCRLHAAIIGYPWPVTLRESAFVFQTEALLDPAAPPQYSPESVPENTNLYGPVYPLFAAPFVMLIPGEPYIAHRLANGLCLVLICALLGWSAAKGGGRLIGFIAAGIFYCATVGSPSLAAGPDNLATLFYVAAIIWVRHAGSGFRGQAGGVVLGFLALMTKPYAVWVLPCLVVYVAWRRSLLRGITFAAIVLVTAAVWAWAARVIWPEYLFSVFFIHAHSATRHFFILGNQILEFGWLYFAPLLLLAFFAPYRRLFIAAKTWRWTTAPQAPFDPDHGRLWLFFMTAAASAPLLLSMGWHPGAHMIYFNHLLLPPLLLAALELCQHTESPSRIATNRLLFLANFVLLIVLIPAMPPVPKTINIPPGGFVLADPMLEPLRKQYPQVDIVDNAEAEYWIENALAYGTPEQKRRAETWERNMRGKIASGHYATLLLAPDKIYQRPTLQQCDHLSVELKQNYVLSGYYQMDFYYAYFRARSYFGREPFPVLIFTRKKSADSPGLTPP